MNVAAPLAALALGVLAAVVSAVAGARAVEAVREHDGEAGVLAGLALALALLLLAGAFAMGDLA